MCVSGSANLREQCPLLPSLVSGLDTKLVRVPAFSVQSLLKNHHPRNWVDGEKPTD